MPRSTPYLKETAMNLPEALQKQKAQFLEVAPQETVDIMHDAIQDLSNSGILASSLKKDDKAVDFTLEDSSGTQVNLFQTLQEGPVILSFFRGDW